ncbi:MAG: hypothetical protein ABIF11_07930 [Nitrospirota bacterium]
MKQIEYEKNVFINCPFDKDYRPIFNAIVFTVHDIGFVAKSALEISDSAQNRLAKIMKIISECKYGIHDISMTDLDPVNLLPRFNMPLELGIYLGCQRFGGRIQQRKACMIMDREPYRYQKFISDIAGQDIHFHNNDPKNVVSCVRDWIRSASGRTKIPGGAKIWERYKLFTYELPKIANKLNIEVDEVTFADFIYAITEWLKGNPL